MPFMSLSFSIARFMPHTWYKQEAQEPWEKNHALDKGKEAGWSASHSWTVDQYNSHPW